MNMRPMFLPRGWYPSTQDEAESAFSAYERAMASPEATRARAAISPHAGWFYSGSYAYSAFRSLDKDADCVIVFGGHRPAGSALLAAFEDCFETPLGPLNADTELREAIEAVQALEGDRYRDNTVEVLLPFVKKFFPAASLLWLRVPNDERSLEIGKLAAMKAAALGRKAVAIGSTDLTHYGPDYGFCPLGLGRKALDWVRNENDKAIVDSFLAMDEKAALLLGEARQAACSAGAAAAAISFARATGKMEASLLGYGTSADRQEAQAATEPEQFVGYCAVSYSPSPS
jgi:MEMO1 family protein